MHHTRIKGGLGKLGVAIWVPPTRCGQLGAGKTAPQDNSAPVTESRSHYCIPCDEEECEIEPKGCRYGIVRNNCNRKVCAKGPGELCGGPSIIWGRCGDDLHCTCNICTGCDSESLDCHKVENCVPPSRLIERY
uniref:Neuroparsin-A n=2 Tax=Timema TaxID=61471 RepID=A0A7R9CIF9_TIMPO|nr:unnamed protein product [Timema douglasi]CAD7397218.1 unnamed protein product [Timema poppensis]